MNHATPVQTTSARANWKWTGLVFCLLAAFLLGSVPAEASSGRPTHLWITRIDPSALGNYATATPETVLDMLAGVTDADLIMAVAGKFAEQNPNLAEKILAAHPEVQSYRYYTINLFAIRVDQGRYQEGVDLLKALIENNLKDQELVGMAVMDLEMLFSYLGPGKAAASLYLIALPLRLRQPGLPDGGPPTGQRPRRWDLVEKYARQRLKVSGPGNGETCFDLGMSLLAQGKSSSQALEYFLQAADAGYQSPVLYNNISGIYLDMEKWAEAEEWALKAYQTAPDYSIPFST